METKGLQRKFKSGACEDYFQTFGFQDDPRVRRRTRLTTNDRMGLRRIENKSAATKKEERDIVLSQMKTAREALKAQTEKKPGIVSGLVLKLKALLSVLGRGRK